MSKNDEKSKTHKRKRPILRVILVALVDLVLIGAGLIVFALFHHVLPQKGTGEALVLPQPSQTIQTAAEPTPEPTIKPEADEALQSTPAPTQDPNAGMWGDKFADKFTDGDPVISPTSYQSHDIYISIEKVEQDQLTYFVADIYLRNIENLCTAFAEDTYGRGFSEKVTDIANANNAIAAITGDYYGARQEGIVIRNGMLYRDVVYEDVLIMNYDGSLETFSPEEFDIETILQNGAYQGWSFGPMLLTDGQPMEEFNSRVNPANPRSAIGYYEPGHYCFVLVDGRQTGYSIGMTLQELSQLFYDLGCTVAYNLDGGKSATMTFMDEIVNNPVGGGREISDIIYITEN